jgi:hypothetical protein
LFRLVGWGLMSAICFESLGIMLRQPVRTTVLAFTGNETGYLEEIHTFGMMGSKISSKLWPATPA